MNKAILSGVLFLTATVASAGDPQNSGLYAGLKTSTVKVKSSDNVLKLDYTLAGVNLGYQFNPRVALEAQYLVNNKAQQFEDARVTLKRYSSVNLIGNYPLSKNVSAYGMLGYGRVQSQAVFPDEKIEGPESSSTYGAGLQFDLERFTLRAGYESLSKKEDIKIRGWMINALYRF